MTWQEISTKNTARDPSTIARDEKRFAFLTGREEGIRTLETLADQPAFQASALNHYATSPNFKWSHHPGLNRGPHPYHGCALPTEL